MRCRLGAALVLAAALGCAAAQSTGGLRQRVDELVSSGYERPDEALRALDRLDDGGEGGRPVRLARGIVAARGGREALARESVASLRAGGDRLATADAELVQAVLAESLGRLDQAALHAQGAADGYAALCPRNAARRGCDHRSPWRALHVLHNIALAQGNRVAARKHMEQALEVAQAADDLFHQASSLASLAAVSAQLGEFDLAWRQLAQAQRLAALDGGPALVVRLRMNEARIAAARGDPAGALRANEEALALALAAGLPRTVALLQGSLSDGYVKAGRPREALRAVEQALPVARRFSDRRAERVLLHNAGLARIGLGQLAEGRRDLERLLELWGQGGAAGDQATALREFGDALAAAGDAKGALELYHRERKVGAGIRAANRDTALRELRTRYDREAQQRDIALLERDNALATTELANRTLLQAIRALVAVMLTLGVAVALLLYRRVRETQRELQRSHALLRVQSERDPLTDLANRRHFQDVMHTRPGGDGFDGALLLVDIDHFKQINDGRGHGAGDLVLVETARRIAQAVREHDLVVRWGGEEFLVYAPRIAADQVDALARRVLRAVADPPVALGDGPLAVTASIGYARCPLPPYSVSLTWERAVNLADLALYTAKSQGRNCAVGITACAAADREALARIEADFARAWAEGRVTLKITPGPA